MKKMIAFLCALTCFTTQVFAAATLPPVDIFTAQPGLYNFNPANLPNFRAAVAKTMRGVSNTNIAFLGDSTTLGFGSSTTANLRRLNGYIPQLSSLLTTRNGIANGWQNLWGDCNATSGMPANDTRVTLATGWYTYSGQFGVCKSFFVSQTASAPLTFTPNVSVDTFDIYYMQGTGESGFANGIFNIQIDSGTAVPVNSGATPNKIMKTTVTAAAGTHTVSINYVSGAAIFIVGIDAYTSTTKQLSLWNWGWMGAQASDWDNSDGFDKPLDLIVATAPNLVAIQLAINDYNNGTETLAQFASHMQNIITALKAANIDVVLTTVFPSQITGNSTQAAQTAFYQAIYSLAKANGVPLIDLNARMKSWASMNALGNMADSLHPNDKGYHDAAEAYLSALLSLM